LYLKIEIVPRSEHHLGCKHQSVNVVQGNNRCLFWNPHKTHKYTMWEGLGIFQCYSRWDG